MAGWELILKKSNNLLEPLTLRPLYGSKYFNEDYRI